MHFSCSFLTVPNKLQFLSYYTSILLTEFAEPISHIFITVLCILYNDQPVLYSCAENAYFPCKDFHAFNE